MKRLYRQILLPLLQVTLFFVIYYYVGNLLLQKFIWPALDHLPTPFRIGLHPFFELDFGRIVNRIFQFVWTLLLFFIFTKFIHKRAVKETILFKPRHKLRTLLWGMLFGGALVTALITLSIATKVVVVKAVHLYPDDLLETLGLYLFCMAITAVAEELALRGYILETLKKNWGTHFAVWISASFFGMIYIGESYYYAYAAFVAGLLLGYAYVWYGIYYCIGWHFAWNFIESVFYSGKLVIYQVNDPFLVGDKAMMPDQEGLLILPILLIGLALMLAVHKTEWHLDSKGR